MFLEGNLWYVYCKLRQRKFGGIVKKIERMIEFKIKKMYVLETITSGYLIQKWAHHRSRIMQNKNVSSFRFSRRLPKDMEKSEVRVGKKCMWKAAENDSCLALRDYQSVLFPRSIHIYKSRDVAVLHYCWPCLVRRVLKSKVCCMSALRCASLN